MDDQSVSQRVLLSLRQIIRAMDLRSRKLERLVGLTVPQLVVLKQVAADTASPIGQIARAVSLSQATVTTIADRLEQRGLIVRERDEKDRRKVMIHLTDTGQDILDKAPTILQEQFLDEFAKIEPWEQTQILATLQRVASMMDASTLGATPLLAVDEIPGEPAVSGTDAKD